MFTVVLLHIFITYSLRIITKSDLDRLLKNFLGKFRNCYFALTHEDFKKMSYLEMSESSQNGSKSYILFLIYILVGRGCYRHPKAHDI